MRLLTLSLLKTLGRSSITVLSAAMLAAACDSTEPSSALAGTWVATSFVFTETGAAPVDVLAAGGGLTIAIAGDNSTTGTLTIPGSIIGGSDFVASMAGTAVRSGNTVTFSQPADTFVRNVVWTVSGDTIEGTLTQTGVTVDITLSRQ
jgi:hypothetical protein